MFESPILLVRVTLTWDPFVEVTRYPIITRTISKNDLDKEVLLKAILIPALPLSLRPPPPCGPCS
jgi:hypothetical protein